MREVDSYEPEVFPPALSRLTGVAEWRLRLVCLEGADPDSVYSADDKAALGRYASWAAWSRHVRRVFREVQGEQQKARTIFAHVMEEHDVR